jgi:hypothetical protein
MITEPIRRGRSSDAGRSAFGQRTELRRLLALGLVQVYAWSHGDRAARDALPALIVRIHAAFVQYLSDDGELAVRQLEEAPRGGASRARALRAAHARQRRALETLCARRDQARTDAFADEFDGLARALLTDIAAEERDPGRT